MLVIERKVYKIYTLRKTADINAILHIIAFIAINNIAALFVWKQPGFKNYFACSGNGAYYIVFLECVEDIKNGYTETTGKVKNQYTGYALQGKFRAYRLLP